MFERLALDFHFEAQDRACEITDTSAVPRFNVSGQVERSM